MAFFLEFWENFLGQFQILSCNRGKKVCAEWRESDRSFLFPGNGRRNSFLTVAIGFSGGVWRVFQVEAVGNGVRKNLLFFLNF